MKSGMYLDVKDSAQSRTAKDVLYYNVHTFRAACDLTVAMLSHMVGNNTDPFVTSTTAQGRTEVIERCVLGFVYLMEKVSRGEMITGKAPIIVHILLRFLRPARYITDGPNSVIAKPRLVYIGYDQSKTHPEVDRDYKNYDNSHLPVLPIPAGGNDVWYDTLQRHWSFLTGIMSKCGPVLFDVSEIKTTTKEKFSVKISRHNRKVVQTGKGKKIDKSMTTRILNAELGNSLGPFTLPIDAGGYYRFKCLGGHSNSRSELGISMCGWGLPASALDYLSPDSTFDPNLFESTLAYTIQSTYPIDSRFETSVKALGGSAAPYAALATSFARSPGRAILTSCFGGLCVLDAVKYQFPILNVAELTARQAYFAHFQKTRSDLDAPDSYTVGSFAPHALRMIATVALCSGDLSFYEAYRDAPNYKNIAIDVEACTLRHARRTDPSNGVKILTFPIVDDGEQNTNFSGDGKFFVATSFPAIKNVAGATDDDYSYNAKFTKGQLIGPTLGGGFFSALGLVYDEYSFLCGKVTYTAGDPQRAEDPVKTTYTGIDVRSITARLSYEWGSDPANIPSTDRLSIEMESDLYWTNCNNGKLAVPTTDSRVGSLNMANITRGVSVKCVKPPPGFDANTITSVNVRSDCVYMETSLFTGEHTHSAARFFNSCFLMYHYYPKEMTAHNSPSLGVTRRVTADDTEWMRVSGSISCVTTVTTSSPNPAKGVLMAYTDATSRDFGGPGDSFLNVVESHGGGLGSTAGVVMKGVSGFFKKAVTWGHNHRGHISAAANFVAKKSEPTNFNKLAPGTKVTIVD